MTLNAKNNFSDSYTPSSIASLSSSMHVLIKENIESIDKCSIIFFWLSSYFVDEYISKILSNTNFSFSDITLEISIWYLECNNLSKNLIL